MFKKGVRAEVSDQTGRRVAKPNRTSATFRRRVRFIPKEKRDDAQLPGRLE